jgi:integrase
VGAGKWLARQYAGDGHYRLHKIGVADDYSDADGVVILDYTQAQVAARKLMVERAGGVGTVGDAVDAYIRYLEADGRSSRAIQGVRYDDRAFIRPVLGHIKLAALTTEQLNRWCHDLAKRPARIRTKKGSPQRYRHSDDADARRARRATARRIWTVLRAALQYAFNHDKVESDRAWRKVQVFRNVDRARTRYLTVVEAQRLINAASPEFRPLLQSAFLTGARLGQLAALTVSDFNPDVGTLQLRTRKGDGSERTYHVHLSDEGRTFFAHACAGKLGSDLLFTHTDGRPWGHAHQLVPMREASARAKLKPAVNFHTTRHTFASLAVMAGAPLLVVARALGHTSTRQVERTYAHLAPSYESDAIRKAAPRYGIKPGGNVRPLR